MSRRLTALLVATAAASCCAAPVVAYPSPMPASDRAVSPTTPAPRVPAYRPPVGGRLTVLRRFDPPVTPYGPGHRGVDLRAAATVLAAGDGIVRFAGAVAGRGVVVIMHADGISTEYEPLRPSVHAGQPVAAGQVIGVVSGRHPGCPELCLHWGARRGPDYLDPLGLLRPLGPVRLLPWTAPAHDSS